MKKKTRQLTHLDHSEIELDDLGSQKCQARQIVHFPGRARRLNVISEKPAEEIDVCQVRDKEGESINEAGTAIIRNGEITRYKVSRTAIQDNEGENKNTDNNAGERDGEVESSKETRKVAPIPDKNGDNRNGFNRVSGRNRKFDGHQVTTNVPSIENTIGESKNDVNVASRSYNLQIKCPSGSDQCNPEESTQMFRRDILDNHYVNEDKWKNDVIANENYFLVKRELQLKCSSELNARGHSPKPNPGQVFVHLNQHVCGCAAKEHQVSPRESIEVNKGYWRRNSISGDVTLCESSLKQGVIGDQHCLRNMRSEYLRSQGVNNIDFWIIISAIIMTYLTALLVVMLWEYLSISLLQRRHPCNSSEIPIMPSTVFPST